MRHSTFVSLLNIYISVKTFSKFKFILLSYSEITELVISSINKIYIISLHKHLKL